MKKLILLISIFVLNVVGEFDASARYKGDLNGDDRVDLADMVHLAKAIKAGLNDTDLDVNASGKVDDTDLHSLADIIISGKLTEDSGFNVGIGGWDETGEDFGGILKSPAFSTRSSYRTRFYMSNPTLEGKDIYSMEFGISEYIETPAAIFLNIELPTEMKFGASGIVELSPEISSTHQLYGTPRFHREEEENEWSNYCLSIIIFSSELSAFPESVKQLGKIYYGGGNYWGGPYFMNCQVVSSSGECSDIEEHRGEYWGNFTTDEVVEIEYINLDPEILTLEVGESYQLKATVYPSNITYPELAWWEEDESVATVDNNGLVTMIGEGETYVWAVSKRWPEIRATCHIVTGAGVEGPTADKATCDIYTSDGQLLKSSVPPSEIQNLKHGFYLIRQRGKTIKLLK